jgi:hypothetical protein
VGSRAVGHQSTVTTTEVLCVLSINLIIVLGFLSHDVPSPQADVL